MKYGKDIIFNPDRLDRFNIDRQMVGLVPTDSIVLEIGCATGFIGDYLIKKKKCVVDGVELGKDEAGEAKKKLREIIQGDIEDLRILKKINLKYDIVYSSALIEHLKDPWNSLKNWKKFLKKDGFILISTSNIAHWSVRVNILKGKFDYTEYGLLDNTHLRFFTYYSFQSLVKDSGYEIDEMKIDAVGGGFPKISKFLAHFFPNVFTYQMLIKAHAKKN